MKFLDFILHVTNNNGINPPSNTRYINVVKLLNHQWIFILNLSKQIRGLNNICRINNDIFHMHHDILLKTARHNRCQSCIE